MYLISLYYVHNAPDINIIDVSLMSVTIHQTPLFKLVYIFNHLLFFTSHSLVFFIFHQMAAPVMLVGMVMTAVAAVRGGSMGRGVATTAPV